jgi:hypothetical protein
MEPRFSYPRNISQDTSAEFGQIYSTGIWMTGSLGIGGYATQKVGLTGSTQSNYEVEIQYVGGINPDEITDALSFEPQSSASISAPGILFGKRFLYPGCFISAEAGLSYLTGSITTVTVTGDDCGWFGGPGECTSSSTRSVNTLGVPLQLGLYDASKRVGFGVEFSADLNPQASFAGISLSVPVGWIYSGAGL